MKDIKRITVKQLFADCEGLTGSVVDVERFDEELKVNK